MSGPRTMRAFAVLATSLALAQANSDMITLTTNGNVYIQEANATLILPQLPGNAGAGDTAIWSAIMMNNGDGDFLQGVTSNSRTGSYCDADASAWCTFAYTLAGNNPIVGEALTASPGSAVTTHYKLESTTNLWKQDVYIDGALKSSVSTSKGQHGNIFYVSIECASGTCGKVPAHQWEDISIVLSESDAEFKHSGSWPHGSTGGTMSSLDGGKTWEFTTLKVPAQEAESS